MGQNNINYLFSSECQANQNIICGKKKKKKKKKALNKYSSFSYLDV